MQQESKIGFLWQYVIACVHPSQYKELIRKVKRSWSVGIEKIRWIIKAHKKARKGD